jgi:UDP-GlcNAc:undecaprenyl-phosphate GlcNAc-1-phosphate transferase
MDDLGHSLQLLGVAVGAGLVSAAACGAVQRASLRLGLVVAPRPDRWHRHPTPTFGGIGVLLGVFAAAVAAHGVSLASAPVLAVGVALFWIGWYDDWAPMSAIAKMVTSLAVAAFFVMTLAGFVSTPIMASLTIGAILAFAGVVNAINLLDNMDGLAAGLSAIAAVGLAAAFRAELGLPIVVVLVGLAGALGGFLFWNRPPARLFMGNCGSLCVGGIIAACATVGVSGAGTPQAFGAAALILIVPLFDSAFVILLRRLAGRSPTQGNIDHTSHRLVAAGFSERAALASLLALGAAGAVAGYLARTSGATWLIAAIVAVALALLAVSLARVPAYGVGEDFRALRRGRFAPLLNDLTFRWHAGEVLLDLVLITICYYLSYRVRFDRDTIAPFLASFSRSLPAIIGCQLAALYASGLYNRSWSTFGVPDAATVVRAVAAGSVLSLMSVTLLYKFEAFSRSVFIIDAVLLFSAIVVTRSSLQMFGRLAARTNPRRQRVAIYGAGTRGQLLAREFLANDGWCRIPVAFVDDDEWLRSRRIMGVPVKGGADELAAILADADVDELLISTPAIDGERESQVRAVCAGRNVAVRRLSLDIA